VYTVSQSLVSIAVGLEGCSVEFQAGGLGFSSDEEFTSWCVIYMEGGGVQTELTAQSLVTVTVKESRDIA
jgi:hypothetical protein